MVKRGLSKSFWNDAHCPNFPKFLSSFHLKLMLTLVAKLVTEPQGSIVVNGSSYEDTSRWWVGWIGVNTLVFWWCGSDFKNVISEQLLQIKFKKTSCDIALMWMPENSLDDKSTLVQVMAWCRQATSHYLSQCWPRSMLSYAISSPQWITELNDNILDFSPRNLW